MCKTEIFRVPIIKTLVYNKPAFLRNIFSNYKLEHNILQTGFMQRFSYQIKTVYSGVIKVDKLFYIVNVQNVSALGEYDIIIYSPKSCRRYYTHFKTEKIIPWANSFQKSLIQFLLCEKSDENWLDNYTFTQKFYMYLLKNNEKFFNKDVDADEGKFNSEQTTRRKTTGNYNFKPDNSIEPNLSPNKNSRTASAYKKPNKHLVKSEIIESGHMDLTLSDIISDELDLEKLMYEEKSAKNQIHNINVHSSNILSGLFQEIDSQIFMNNLFGESPKKVRPNYTPKNKKKDAYRRFINKIKDKFIHILKNEFWNSMFLINMDDLIYFDEKKMSSYFMAGDNALKLQALCSKKVYQSGEHNEIDIKIFLKLNKQEFKKRDYDKPENSHLVKNQITNKGLSDSFGHLSYADTSLYKLGLNFFSNSPFYQGIKMEEIYESIEETNEGNFCHY